MGRPRGGKAKKSTETAKVEDAGSGSGGDEAVTPAYRRMGRRPQKQLKVDTDGEDGDVVVKAEEDSDGADPAVPGKGSAEDGGKKKRRRRRPQRRRGDPVMDEEEEGKGETPGRPNGFRRDGSRRKSTPRRAAEAGV